MPGRRDTERGDQRLTKPKARKPASQAGGPAGAIDRRGKTWRRLAAVDAPNDTDQETIDGIAFDYRGELRCHTCSAADPDRGLLNGPEVRSEIDAGIIAGDPYALILRRVEPMVTTWPEDHRPSYAGIRRHALRHLGGDAAAIRTIVERRAIEAGLQIAAGQSPLVTRAAILELVRRKGFTALASGAIAPAVKETLDAAAALEEIDTSAGNLISVEDLARQAYTFFEVVRERLDPDAWEAVVAEAEARLGSGLTSPEEDRGRD
jgi:hypothetical protein